MSIFFQESENIDKKICYAALCSSYYYRIVMEKKFNDLTLGIKYSYRYVHISNSAKFTDHIILAILLRCVLILGTAILFIPMIKVTGAVCVCVCVCHSRSVCV